MDLPAYSLPMIDQKKTVTIDGHKIAYLRVGAGEPLVLVHGITTYSFIWRNLLARLATKYEVFALDLLGCGDSDKPLDVSYALKDHAERIHEFVEKMGLKRFHYIGHDLGGGIGQIFAARYPDFLYDLSLINTVAYDFWPVQPITAMRTPIVRQLMMASLDLGTFRLIVSRGIYHKEKVTDELMDLFMKPMHTHEGRKGFLHFARCLNNQDLMEIADRLPTLPMPVLIVRGSADLYLSATISNRLHQAIPGSQLVTIETGGHFLMEDEPEQLADILINFMNRRSD